MATILELNDKARHTTHMKRCGQCRRARTQGGNPCPTGYALQVMSQADQKRADAHAALIAQFRESAG